MIKFMVKLVIFFLILLTAAWVGLQIHNDPGYFYLSIHEWTIEMPAWLAIGLCLLMVIIFYVFISLIKNVTNIPHILNQWILKLHVVTSNKNTQLGLIAFTEGNWSHAQKLLRKALPYAAIPYLNNFIIAKTEFYLKNQTDYFKQLDQIKNKFPQSEPAIILSQAKLYIKSKQWELALKSLLSLPIKTQKTQLSTQLFLLIYQATNNWPALFLLLPNIRKYNLLNDQDFKALQQNCYLKNFEAIIHSKTPTKQTDKQIDDFIKNLPKELSTDTAIQITYAKFLLKNNAIQLAEKIIHALPEQNHQTLLCLGELCIAQKLWGKAKQYLEESIQSSPTNAAYFQLAQLYLQLNDTKNAIQNFQKIKM